MKLDATDRRVAPRRLEEIALSVAEMSLLAAALKLASAHRLGADTTELLAQVERSACFYETAERDAIASRQVVRTP